MTRRASLLAAALYVVLAVGMTWPLVTVIDHEIAWDMGDPVLNAWIIQWTGGQVLAFLSGDLGALGRYWHGNIFYPEPLTIAYSEHLTPQMLQALPILAATDNVILGYNLVFLATFVLSGLGMFLLVRDLTGRPVAALIAGIAFAFAPYRISQLSHVQVLSAQWMPFVLYGFRRFLETGRRRSLVGGSAALVAQNLSCGYYLLFFSPFAAAYVVYELAARRRLRDWATWRAFSIAAVVVGAMTLPFLLPYLSVRDSGVGVRSLGEISMFSADVHAFATAPGWSWLWGERLDTFLRPEGEAFPGLSVLGLAAVGILAGLAGRWPSIRQALVRASAGRQVAIGALLVLTAVHIFATVIVLTTAGFPVLIQGVWAESREAGGVLLRTVLLAAALVTVVMHPFRRREGIEASPWLFYAVAAVAAAVLALGPNIAVAGLVVSPGPYALLMQYVPGFDGLRVPARYVMLVALFLAVLAGLGASALIARARRFGTACVIAAGVFMMVEGWAGPFQTDVPIDAYDMNLTPRPLPVGRRIPPVYRIIRDSAEPVVLIEFPFGVPAWDLFGAFNAGYHRKPLVNGYSGFFPNSQLRLIGALNARTRDPNPAWRALVDTGVTHILVHEGAFPVERGAGVSDWLRTSGARELVTDGTDRLFAVR